MVDAVAIASEGLERAKADPEVKNVVLDISNNGGGSLDVLEYIASAVCGRKDFQWQNTLTGQLEKEYFDVDRNLDGVFDEKDDAVDGLFISGGKTGRGDAPHRMPGDQPFVVRVTVDHRSSGIAFEKSQAKRHFQKKTVDSLRRKALQEGKIRLRVNLRPRIESKRGRLTGSVQKIPAVDDFDRHALRVLQHGESFRVRGIMDADIDQDHAKEQQRAGEEASKEMTDSGGFSPELFPYEARQKEA